MRKANLVDVTCSNVILRGPNHFLELDSSEPRTKRNPRKIWHTCATGKVSRIVPSRRSMKKNGGFSIEAEPEVSVKSDPSDGGTLWKTEICARLSPRCQLAFQYFPITRVSLENQIGFPRQERNGIGSGKTGFEKYKALAGARRARHLFRCQAYGIRCIAGSSSHHVKKFPKVRAASMFFCLSNRPRAAYLGCFNVVHPSIVRRLFGFCGGLACTGAALSNACRGSFPVPNCSVSSRGAPADPRARAWDHSLAEPRAGFGCFALAEPRSGS